MDRAFGIIPFKGGKTLLVKHQKGHWAFPKGHAESAESPQEAAVRELKEETALIVIRLFGQPLRERYSFDGIEKEVTYFLADVEGEVTLQEEEIADARWVDLDEGEELATFAECKALFQKLKGL